MPSRRDLLKAAGAAAATASSIGFGLRQASAQAARSQIDGVLRRGVDDRDAAGVVAMAATDKGVLYEGVAGLRALDQTAAMTTDTVFRIASMTKAITSVAAMQMVEQGKLKLDEPVPGIDPALASPQVLEGFDASGARKAPSGQAADHAAASADAHGGLRLRSVGPKPQSLHQSFGPAAASYRQGGDDPLAPGVRSRGSLALRHQHRLGGASRRSRPAGSRSTRTSGTRSSLRSE